MPTRFTNKKFCTVMTNNLAVPGTRSMMMCMSSTRASLLQKWLKMVFTPLLGFGGSFDAYVLLAFTSMPWRSKRARFSLNVSWEDPSHGICWSSHDLPPPQNIKICLSNKLKLNPKRQKKN
jgi:hypothetical protein